MRGLVAAIVSCTCALACAEAPRDSPRDAGADAKVIEPLAKTCADCHVEHAFEHRSSAHARAFTSPLFQREWRRNPSDFCIGCHAPRADDARDPIAREGVDCESCHVVDGMVRAARVSGAAPHPVREDPSLATVDACARCHQVDFPRIPGQPLQNTVAEWHAAGEPGGACQTCHVPESGDRHAHHFPGGHDVAMLRHAIAIDASAEHDGWDTRVDVRIEGTGAGHAVPTGDVFRRLVVRAWREDRPEEIAIAELGRHFTTRDGRPWSPLRDDRVPARAVRHVSLLVRGRAERVRWSIEMRSVPLSERDLEGIPAREIARPNAAGTIELE